MGFTAQKHWPTCLQRRRYPGIRERLAGSTSTKQRLADGSVISYPNSRPMRMITLVTDAALAEQAFRIGMVDLGIPIGGCEPRPVDLAEARRAFLKASEIDPGMCDAWMGIAMVNMQEHRGSPAAAASQSVVENCYRTRARLGANQSRLGVAPHTLTGMYSAGMVQLPMRTVNDTCLAYAAGLAMNSQYDEAVQLISEIHTDPSKRDALRIPDYLLGLIYWRTERWPDVLSALGAIEWRESVILDAVNYMAGMASAHLGMFIEAGRKLDAISPSTPGTSAIYDRALLERAYIHREEGDESQARALFETIHTRRSDPDLVSSAARALADPQDRIKVVTDRWIATRTDYWDPSSAVGLEAIGASAGRAEVLKKAAESLDRLVGLEAVKEDIKDIESNVRVTQKLREKGLPAGELTENILLSGPAGTGKTEVARILAKIFAGYGAVETDKFVEVTEEDLVSKYVGETRERTSKKITEALGGVLFIDEVYTLVKESREHNHGQEAIEGLLHRMENDRGRLVVIVAGYEEDINRFLRINEGLESRFTQRIRFASYTPEELVAIAERLAPAQGSPLTPEAKGVLYQACAQAYNSLDTATGHRSIDALGNGRFIRSVIKRATTARNRRLCADIDLDAVADHTHLIAEDILSALDKADFQHKVRDV